MIPKENSINFRNFLDLLFLISQKFIKVLNKETYLLNPAIRTGFTISYIITKREQKTIACPYLVMNSHYDIA